MASVSATPARSAPSRSGRPAIGSGEPYGDGQPVTPLSVPSTFDMVRLNLQLANVLYFIHGE